MGREFGDFGKSFEEVEKTKNLFCFLTSLMKSQNIEGILPVATLSIALYVLRRSMSDSDVAPEVAILLSAL